MRRSLSIAGCLAASLLPAACGGSSDSSVGPPQTKASGTYTVEVTKPSFPAKQHLDRESVLKIEVRNTGDRALPDVAVSVTTDNAGTSAPTFALPDSQPGLAQRYQPVWILDEGPVGGENALANTWTLGNLAPGESKTFTWRAHPIRTGFFTVRWAVAPAMLGGKAQFADGSPAAGSLPAEIEGKAPSATVAPNGKVVKKYSN